MNKVLLLFTLLVAFMLSLAFIMEANLSTDVPEGNEAEVVEAVPADAIPVFVLAVENANTAREAPHLSSSRNTTNRDDGVDANEPFGARIENEAPRPGGSGRGGIL